MPMTYCCPFWTWEEKHALHCKGATISFRGKMERKSFVMSYCANNPGWRRCPMAQEMLEEYERMDKNGENQEAQSKKHA